MAEITEILHRIESGDHTAMEKLLPLVYDELHRLAAWKMAQEAPGHTLQATALVHEAYLRLLGPDPKAASWESRAHFFSAAAEAMRRILIESARRKKRLKHGGDLERVDLSDIRVMAGTPAEDLLALDEALSALAEVDSQTAELVKLRYFVGMTLEQASESLGMSLRTGNRTWAFARAWLYRHLHCTSELTSE